MNKKLITNLSIGAAIVLTSFASKAELTANFAAHSNYYWRGVTQTQNGAALSGGIDYANDSGFYLGAWTSNVDFGEGGPSYELDLYGGFSQSIGDVSYDVGYLYYAYPDAASDIDFGEVYGAVSWQWLSLQVNYLTNADGDASSEKDMLYTDLNASFDLSDKHSIAFHLGYSKGDTITEWFDEDSYLDYGVSWQTQGFTLGLVKTDLADDDLHMYVSYSLDFSL